MLQRYDYFRNLPKKTASIFTFYKLPQIFLDIAVEGGFLRPAEVEEGLADGGFDVGGDGAAGAVVFVVALARKEGDEVVLDVACEAAGDDVVHLAEAEGHTKGFTGAVARAVVALHPGVLEVYDGHDGVILRDIVLQDVAQAVFASGAAWALADATLLHHFAEKFFSCLWGSFG